MSANSGVPTVLIVDDDLAFVWWLGEAFIGAGYQAVPALECHEALALSEELGVEVDLVAVNPKLPGAARMVETLANEKANLRVIWIGTYDGGNLGPPGPGSATLTRPNGSEKLSRSRWLRKVRNLLETMSTSDAAVGIGNTPRSTTKGTLR